jgi:hypothetical protein
MSKRNGDRARFQINRRRKLQRRQRVRALANTLKKTAGATGPRAVPEPALELTPSAFETVASDLTEG